jgi:hypothetical protein
MHPLQKTLLLVSACLFVFGSAQAQEATDDSQVTNEARQAERDARRAQWESMSDEERAAVRSQRDEARNRGGRNRDEMRQRMKNMSDEERQAMRQRRENMSDEERAAMKKRRQQGNAARNSQRQRPSGKGRPKDDPGASIL